MAYQKFVAKVNSMRFSTSMGWTAQINIPKANRDALNLKEGDYIPVIIQNKIDFIDPELEICTGDINCICLDCR